MLKIFKTQHGFTVIEIISVLVILGILVAVVVSGMQNYNTTVSTGADALRAHLRYAQTMAMNRDPNVATETIMGINYNSSTNQYWLFGGTNPSNNILFLPDDSQYMTKLTNGNKINLTAKQIQISFSNGINTIYFDSHGIPYTAYTNSTTNTPLASLLTISVTALSGSSSSSITIAPETGFIQ